MASRKKRQHEEGRATIVDLLLRMEPELKQLQGGIEILRALGETAESVEPIALATLARCCESGFEQLMALWRTSLDSAR
ncbi:hypothetical protein [Tianweitania sediminis]|uniref:Uncharacterized protein n=1 Tax=Tianweitania sediminis TaxID=1502156 RepID=A0A8J7R4W9_9HYPH|nr:hypothetical protein [Tianweitania sediminis]MBP0441283.1 hypothetical protein [Tianweitania sediminis]